MEKLNQILENPVYKQVVADSFGGVMYNVANRDKYDDKEIVDIWNSMSDYEQSLANGIAKGAMQFLTEDC